MHPGGGGHFHCKVIGRVKTKSYQKVFSKLEEIVPQTVIRLFKLTDFLPGFYRACLFADG